MVTKITTKDYEDVIANNEIVLIDFYATWCGPCKMLSPIIDEASEEMPENVKVVKVDVDEEKELASKFGISSIPTLVVIKDGKAVRQALGYRPKEAILSMVKF